MTTGYGKRGAAHVAALVFTGILSGFCSGFFGTGGGMITVFMLSRAGRLRAGDFDRRDVFSEALASTLPVAAFTAFLYTRGGVSISGAETFLLPAALGGVLGAFLLDRLRPGVVGKIFSALVIWAGASMLLRG